MRKTPLRRCSKKQQERNRIYRGLRRQYLEDNPLCECGCGNPSTQIHHMGVKGGVKRGSNTNNVSTWMAVCYHCHEWIEMNKTEAREKGWLA